MAVVPAPPRRPSASAGRRRAPRSQAVKLPAASRWALPPLIRVRPGSRPTGAGVQRALRNPALALAPGVAKALRRGQGTAAIAPLADLAPSAAGPLLVLRIEKGAAVTQAASIERTREVVAALADLPLGERPKVLLEPAPGDLADASGPPPPRAGELRSLKPVYMQAGMRHGIAWQVLAAINTVETGLGTNMSVSSAGAVGWMQFMPGTWRIVRRRRLGRRHRRPERPVRRDRVGRHLPGGGRRPPRHPAGRVRVQPRLVVRRPRAADRRPDALTTTARGAP